MKMDLTPLMTPLIANNSAIPPVAAKRCRFIKVEDISPILLRQIAKDIGVALDELLKNR